MVLDGETAFTESAGSTTTTITTGGKGQGGDDYDAVVGESYHGCFKDTGKRDLPTLLKGGYGNYKKCFELAIAGNHEFAGL